MAKLLHIEVDKIYLYPLGGISKFNLSLNDSIKKEFLILIAGPIFQELAKYLLLILLPTEQEIIYLYHYGILIFNLLPVYPLDGGKLINLLLSIFLPIKTSFNLSIYLSYLIIIIYFVINITHITINTIIITMFLIYKVTKEKKQISYLYQKMLLERHLKKIKYHDTKLIKDPNKFYRNHNHLLKIGDNYYYEKDFLIKKYKK